MGKRNVIYTFIVIALVFCMLLTSCGQKADDKSTSTDTEKQIQPAETSKEEAKDDKSTEAKEDAENVITVRGWVDFVPSPDAPEIQTWNDQILWKEQVAKTGVKVVWEHVSSEEYEAQIGLLIASGDLPDLIGRISPTLAAQYGVQGAFIPLQDLIEEHAPNLKKILNDRPEVRGQITAPDGNIYFFPRLLLDKETQCYTGWTIRGDWVEEVGMQLPETTDDLYNVFKAIKEKYPEKYPLFLDPRPLIWAFGVGSRGTAHQNDFFVENGEIKYGPTDPRYKDALMYLNKLYSEGLLDREYLSINSGYTDEGIARAVQEIGACTFGSNAGYLTKFNRLLEAAGKNPGFVAMKPPQGPTGERNILGRHTEIDPTCGAVITTTSKYAVEITKMMDYLYSEEGRLLVDFGIEGDTYTMENGKPVYTEKVLNHPTLTLLDYLNNYVGRVSTWPTVLMPEHYLATLTDPQALLGCEIAVQYGGNKKPPVLHFTDEELQRVQELSRDIDTYVDENMHAFIMGEKSFDEYDNFLKGFDTIGVDELIELYNTAYQRFKAASGQ